MMKKQQSHWWRIAWIAVTVPLVGFSLMAFSKPKEVLKEAVDNSVRIIEQPIAEVLNTAETPAAPTVVEEPQQAAAQPAPPDEKPIKMVTGKVSDESGKPLAGATVFETDQYGRIVASAIADNNGNYALKVVNPEHKMRISYVGYKTQTLDIGSKVDVTLQSANMMTNITVVGRRDSIDPNSPRYKDDAAPNEDAAAFNLVEQAPQYPGGQREIINYLNRNLRYPPVAREMHVEADITVRFTIDKTGFVRSPQVVNVSSQSPLVTDETAKAAKEGDEEAVEASRNYYDAVEALKEEAIHVVRSMPRWEPGRQNGKRIESTFTLPITFKLN